MSSIRRRLTLTLLIGLGLIWGVSQSFVFQIVKQATVKVFDSEMQPIANDVRFFTMPNRPRERSMSPFGGNPPRPSSSDREQGDDREGTEESIPESPPQFTAIDNDEDGEKRMDPPERRMPEILSQRAELFSTIDSGLYFRILDRRNGQTVHISPSLNEYELPLKQGVDDKSVFWDDVLPNGQRVRVMAQRSEVFDLEANAGQRDFFGPGAMRPPEMRPVYLLVARDRSDLDSSLSATLLAFVGVGVCGAVVTVILVSLLLGKGLAPLKKLAARVSKIDERSLDYRFEEEGNPSELKPIIARLNDLLGRLEQGFQREKRFSSDAAHELRTPVAELRVLAETAIRWPENAPKDGYDKILQISARMQRILEGLLKLGRLDSGMESHEFEKIELNPFLSYMWERYEEAAQEKEIRMTWNCDESATLKTNADVFGLIFENLFSNLVEYAPHGSGASLFVTSREDGSVSIVLSNRSDHLDEESVKRLFERFWRADKSRTDTSHSGLGLSLVQACVRFLGLEIKATLDEGSLLSFHLIKNI